MQLNGIGPLAGLAQPGIAEGARSSNTQGKTGASSSFGETVGRAVEALDSTQKSSEMEVARAVSGESPDLHQTIVALQAADLNFQFALQVRNKLIGAYEEIMRMQV